MAPKRKQASKAEEQSEDAGVDAVDPPKKDMSKVPGGKAGGAASGQHHKTLTSYIPVPTSQSALPFTMSNEFLHVQL